MWTFTQITGGRFQFLLARQPIKPSVKGWQKWESPSPLPYDTGLKLFMGIHGWSSRQWYRNGNKNATKGNDFPCIAISVHSFTINWCAILSFACQSVREVGAKKGIGSTVEKDGNSFPPPHLFLLFMYFSSESYSIKWFTWNGPMYGRLSHHCSNGWPMTIMDRFLLLTAPH